MSGNTQISQATASTLRSWPSMAAASAMICRSSRSNEGEGTLNSVVLSLVVEGFEASEKFAAIAGLEGQVVVTIAPEGSTGETLTFTIPMKARVIGAEASGGTVEVVDPSGREVAFVAAAPLLLIPVAAATGLSASPGGSAV